MSYGRWFMVVFAIGLLCCLTVIRYVVSDDLRATIVVNRAVGETAIATYIKKHPQLEHATCACKVSIVVM